MRGNRACSAKYTDVHEGKEVVIIKAGLSTPCHCDSEHLKSPMNQSSPIQFLLPEALTSTLLCPVDTS